jgi:hypothetical protein
MINLHNLKKVGAFQKIDFLVKTSYIELEIEAEQ